MEELRNRIKQMYRDGFEDGKKAVLDYLKEKLVLCEECEHLEPRTMYCEINRRMTDERDYCSYGRRKHNEPVQKEEQA